MMQANIDLKTKLFGQIKAVGKEQSLLPFSETLIDEIIRQLENISPIPRLLHPSNFT